MKKYILYIVAALWVAAFVWATVAHADGADVPYQSIPPVNPQCQQYCSYQDDHSYHGVMPPNTVILPPVVVEQPPPPPPPPPSPLGWVYGRYVACERDGARCLTSVDADGVNVRRSPNGPVFLSLTNNIPLFVLQQNGAWVLIAVPCELVPTGVWSDTARVPLHTCAS